LVSLLLSSVITPASVRNMPSYSISQYVVGIQGGFNILNGLGGLISDEMTRKNGEFLGIESMEGLRLIALSTVGLGVFMSMAAYQHNRPTMWMSLPGRLLGVAVFAMQGGVWSTLAVWETICAGATGAALAWEEWGPSAKGKSA